MIKKVTKYESHCMLEHYFVGGSKTQLESITDDTKKGGYHGYRYYN
jgi:hypothetical protein